MELISHSRCHRSVRTPWWELAKLFEAVHGAIYAGQNLTVTPRGVGAALTAVAPFFAAIPTAMFIGNILVWLVPPARRALDAEAKPHPGTDFRASQHQMLLLIRYLVVPALGVALLGALLPWSA